LIPIRSLLRHLLSPAPWGIRAESCAGVRLCIHRHRNHQLTRRQSTLGIPWPEKQGYQSPGTQNVDNCPGAAGEERQRKLSRQLYATRVDCSPLLIFLTEPPTASALFARLHPPTGLLDLMWAGPETIRFLARGALSRAELRYADARKLMRENIS